MSEPKFTGVWIPSSVFQTPTISLTAKVVYGVVDALDNEEGCFASNAYLSRHLGLSVRQLQTILSELEDARLIRRVACEGHRVIRTVEKVALQDALASTQVTRTEGDAENRIHIIKKIIKNLSIQRERRTWSLFLGLLLYLFRLKHSARLGSLGLTIARNSRSHSRTLLLRLNGRSSPSGANPSPSPASSSPSRTAGRVCLNPSKYLGQVIQMS